MITKSRQYYFQSHMSAQRGFYFDSVSELQNGVYVATSNIISDPYWNYGFFSNDTSFCEKNVPELIEYFLRFDRQLSVLLSDDDPVIEEKWFQTHFEEFSGDTWMVSVEPRNCPPLSDTGLSIEIITRPDQIEAACSIFNDAYLSPSPDGVGYSGLPPEYVEAFRRGLERSPQFGSVHCLGSVDGVPVAIASCYFAGRSAGIYNVAVSRGTRRQGFGRSISNWIIKLAKDMGATDVFLQTEPNSAVQCMYEGLGFEILMRGILFTKRK